MSAAVLKKLRTAADVLSRQGRTSGDIEIGCTDSTLRKCIGKGVRFRHDGGGWYFGNYRVVAVGTRLRPVEARQAWKPKKKPARAWSMRISRPRLQTRFQLRQAGRTNAGTCGSVWDSGVTIETRKKSVQALCGMLSVKYPEVKKKDWGIYPEMLRTSAPEWWGRQLKKANRRDVEAHHLKAGAISHYCSDEMLSARMAHRKETVALLEQLIALSDAGDEVSLLKLAKGSQANPAVRRAELMVSMRGLTDYSKRQGHEPWFFTITAPSKYHRISGERWNGASPREVQAYLQEVWQRARAALQRAGVVYYGLRIAEPHKDACPHWHMLLWYADCESREKGNRIIAAYFLAEDKDEPGARDNRVKIKHINSAAGDAVGYVSKYICKNIDGLYDDPEQGEGVSFDQKTYDATTGKLERAEMRSLEAALRVEAWATCWGIRQFQRLGTPPIGVWRELRRMEPGNTVIEPIREAADAGQFDMFVELMNREKEAGKKVKVWSDNSGDMIAKEAERAGGMHLVDDKAFESCLNKWKEPALRKVRGLLAWGYVRIITRVKQWVLTSRRVIEAQRERTGDAPLWFVLGSAAPPAPLEHCQ